MAGASQSRAPDSRKYVEYEEYVDFQLEKTRAIVKRTDILTTLMALAVGVVGYLLTFVVLDQWIIDGGFGYGARVVLLLIVSAVVVGTLAWRVVWPLLRQVHPLYAARVIEQSDPNLKSNLVNFVDVKLANAESAPVVLKSMQKRAAVELSHIDVEEAVDHRPLLRIAYALLGVVIVAAIYIFWSPKDTFVSVRRALLPTSSIAVATKTVISDVDPGDKDVPARTRQLITAEVRGEEADQAQILFTTADHKYVDEPVKMRRESAGLSKFVGELNGENGKGLLQSLTYRIVAGDARTTDYTINVIQPPSAQVDEVHYVYPKYTELPEKTTSGGDIDGWEGTIVTIKATANMKVAFATVVMTDTDDKSEKGESVSMQVTNGTSLSASWKLEFRSDGTSPRFYHIRVRTENQKRDEIDADPTQYVLRIRPDQRPDVALLDPTGDLTRPANAIIPLAVQASDPDFKVRSVMLRGTRGGESLSSTDIKLFEDQLEARSVAGTYNFQLERLGLKPGERIQIWIEAKDNKAPTANRTNTTPINITIAEPVSPAEVQKQLAKDEQLQQEQLARNNDTNNPDGAAKDRAEARDGDKGDEPVARREERPDTGAAQPREKQEPGAEETGERVWKDDKNGPDKRQKPIDNDEALSRLLKKQRPADEGNQDSDEKQEQQQPSDQKSADQTQQKPGDGDGEGRSGQDRSKNQKSSQSDQSKSDGDRGGEKSANGTRQGNQNQTDDDKSDADKGSAPGKKADKTGNNQKSQPNANDKNRQQDKDAATKNNENQAGEKSDSGDSDKSSDDTKGTGDKSKSKTKPGSERQDGAGPSDKTKPGKQTGNEDNAGSNPSTDKQERTKQDGKKQGGSGEDDGRKDAADKNAGREKAAGKGTDQHDGDDASDGDKGQTKAAAKKASDTGDQDPSQPDKGGEGSKGNKAKKDKNKKPAADQAADGDEQQPGKAQDKKQQEPKDGGAGNDDGSGDDPKNPQQKNKEQGGAGTKAADKSEPGEKSDDDKNSTGTPGTSDKSESDGDNQAGEAGGEKSPKIGKGPKKNDNDANPNGPEKPADDDGTAKNKPATGDEKGEASGDEGQGDRQSPRAGENVKKKEGSAQGSKKSAAGDDLQNKKATQKRGPDDGATGGADDAENAERAPDDKKARENPGRVDNPPAEKGVERRKEDSERRPSQNPEAGNQQMKGTGRKEGQKSEQPETGEQGSGSATDQGKPGANKAGPGDKSDEPGNNDAADEKTGQPGSKQKGKGSSTKPSDDNQGQEQDAAGDKAGDKGPGKKGASGKGGKDGEGEGEGSSDAADGKPSGKSGQKGGKPSGQGGKDSGNQPGGQQGTGKSSQPGSGQQKSGGGISSNPGKGSSTDSGEPQTAPGDDAEPRERSAPSEPTTAEQEAENLENAKKATNLVLKRLKSQLERGEVDQQMLDELGWKDRKDVEKFVRYLEDNLKQNADDDSPEAQARRMQFEETLKNLDVGSDTQRRSGSVGKERAIDQIGSKNTRPPREYEKIWESYTRSLSKQAEKEKSDAKPKAADKTKKPVGK